MQGTPFQLHKPRKSKLAKNMGEYRKGCLTLLSIYSASARDSVKHTNEVISFNPHNLTES